MEIVHREEEVRPVIIAPTDSPDCITLKVDRMIVVGNAPRRLHHNWRRYYPTAPIISTPGEWPAIGDDFLQIADIGWADLDVTRAAKAGESIITLVKTPESDWCKIQEAFDVLYTKHRLR